MAPLEQILHNEIQCSPGAWISFERFMTQALYHLEYGYYARIGSEHRIGRGGDFITSASTGSLFGRLLARQLILWWYEMGKPSPFILVEAGGLDGRLAKDILGALAENDSDCFNATQYTLVEPLQRLKEVQQRTLSEIKKVKWVTSLRELARGDGVLLANELLDAFPVKVFERNEIGFREWGVVAKEDFLAWKLAENNVSMPEGIPDSYRGRIEVCPAAISWLRDVTRFLRQGKILLFDYGRTDQEYFEVNRPMGTLRGYRQHQYAENLLENPGEQDLTAHVRWTPLQREATRLGWREDEFIEQGRWLTRILVREPSLELNAKEIRQFQTLTHPSMFGASFRVMILAK